MGGGYIIIIIAVKNSTINTIIVANTMPRFDALENISR
jgi:hypothetical protein